MTPSDAKPVTLSDLVSHMGRSHGLARRSEQLAAEADNNDAELDRLIAQREYTIDEVRSAMLIGWSGQ